MPPLTFPGSVLTQLALAKKSQPAPESVKCQKCLQSGHWTYQCTNPAKYVARQSRTTELKKELKQRDEEAKAEKLKQMVAETRRRKRASSTSSSSSSSDDSSSSSSSDSDGKRNAALTKSKEKKSSSSSSSSGSSSSSSSSSDDADSEPEGDTRDRTKKRIKKAKL